uniref:Uncharacterized protein n=1 Tax=Anguilla anguilla TaxID=7936 RepID=A0A0E9XHX6_ANGAN
MYELFGYRSIIVEHRAQNSMKTLYLQRIQRKNLNSIQIRNKRESPCKCC